APRRPAGGPGRRAAAEWEAVIRSAPVSATAAAPRPTGVSARARAPGRRRSRRSATSPRPAATESGPGNVFVSTSISFETPGVVRERAEKRRGPRTLRAAEGRGAARQIRGGETPVGQRIGGRGSRRPGGAGGEKTGERRGQGQAVVE